MQQKYLDNNEPHIIFSMLDPPKGSVIWDFMIASRDIVLKHISWELNCGNKINFWGDSWNGHPPLNTMPNIQNIVSVIEAEWSNLVIHFMDAICIFSRKVIWKDLDQFPLDPQCKQQLQSIFSERQAFVSKVEDQLLWILAKNGNYSIKEGYKLLQ